MTQLPEHLGGHANYTNEDAGVLDLIIAKYRPKSMLDIGCGPGGMLREAVKRGMVAKGIDGDFTLDYAGLDVVVHDFTMGPAPVDGEYDLGWSVEFLEHIEEQYLPNIAQAFQRCRYVFVTHALPRQVGWHHVNCQPEAYWLRVFRSWGFNPIGSFSKDLRKASTMQGPYARRTGLFFERV
jgi:SAM-dependent methyltransferase